MMDSGLLGCVFSAEWLHLGCCTLHVRGQGYVFLGLLQVELCLPQNSYVKVLMNVTLPGNGIITDISCNQVRMENSWPLI